VIAVRVALVGAAAALLVCAPVARATPRSGLPAGTALGLLGGLLSFVVLARPRRPLPLARRHVARAVLLLAPSITATALVEEVLWRYGAFGALDALAGTVLAAAAATIGFAAAHAPHGSRAVRAGLVTGCVFVTVYIVTGRLAAAVLAHALYNLLVVASSSAERPRMDPAAEPT
jgi:membrane protease YdiL (CAAX protease family)